MSSYVAAYLTDDSMKLVGDYQAKLQAKMSAAISWVDPDKFHVTLAYISSEPVRTVIELEVLKNLPVWSHLMVSAEGPSLFDEMVLKLKIKSPRLYNEHRKMLWRFERDQIWWNQTFEFDAHVTLGYITDRARWEENKHNIMTPQFDEYVGLSSPVFVNK